MSELPKFRDPEILGIPPFENPLLDPEADEPVAGELESAFSPQPGEEVPPADILANIFPANGDPYQPVPDTLDEVQALAHSIEAFRDRSSPKSRGRLGPYAAALEAKEDELDPPLGRLLRSFKQEVTGRFEGMEDLDDLLDTIFGQQSKHTRLSDETYGQWSDLFYANPKAIPLFYMFVETARHKDHLRKDWLHDRQHLVYPSVRDKLILERQQSTPLVHKHAKWLIESIQGAEEALGHLGTDGEEWGAANSLEAGRVRTHGFLAGIAWSMFASPRKGDLAPMLTYDYDGLNDLLARMKTYMVSPPLRGVLEKFSLDTMRIVGNRMVKQGMITRQGESLYIKKPRGTDSRSAMKVLESALAPGDGYIWPREEFDAAIRGKLGPVELGEGEHFRSHNDIISSELGGLSLP